jgi:hypothetical protein
MQRVQMRNSVRNSVNLTLSYVTDVTNNGKVPFLVVTGQVSKAERSKS